MNEKIAIIKTQKYLNEYSFLRNDEECILNLIDEYKEDFLKIVNQNYVNVDGVIDDIIEADGYGHTLNFYDGNADEVTIQNETYYVMRIN
jgi:hypothetical protein